jgi:FKBP-type peptidyl-prolyl cis-trans isomerase 2
MPIKQNDFVEIEYTGRLKESNIIFDTTDADVAKAHDLPKAGQYGPVVICLGQGQLLRGLEDELKGKEPGKYTVELSPEKAFGKKNAKLIQMVPAKKFLENKIQPVPGLQLNIDGAMCTIRQVTGGRVMVDFNHPLAGRDVVYDVKIGKLVTEKKEQLKALIAMLLNISDEKITVADNKATLEFTQALPDILVPELQKKIKELTGLDADIKLPPKKKGAEKNPADEHAGHNHPPGENHDLPKADKKPQAKPAGQQKLADAKQ